VLHLQLRGILKRLLLANSPAETDQHTAVLRGLSPLDRLLPVWIGAAMLAGIGIGRAFPGLNAMLDSVKVDTVSLPIALGLLLMMYPVLARVRYDDIGHVTADRRMLGTSLVLNWLVGPALMFTLAWLFLPDLPAYRTGLIIVGLARCIAMVLIWNDLACGDREAAVVLVALNSLFQIVAYSLLGYFYLEILPGWLGLGQATINVSMWQIGLLFTVVILFALQGDTITRQPLDVTRIAVPLIAYFAIMWTSAFALSKRLGLGYPRAASVAFTAAGNNFELAIAVAISVFGVTSGEALAGVVGPLIEVPVLVGLVYVALWVRQRWFQREVPA